MSESHYSRYAPRYMTESSAPRVVEIPPNDAGGRDLVFGDIHGCFATVESALAELRYDPARDRLFSLGDTIDYGPRSGDALEWMQSRFTCTVRGNHEDMMLDYLRIGARIHNDGGAWRRHWASCWFPASSTHEQRAAWRRALGALPITITIALPDGGRVGLVHGYGGSDSCTATAAWSDRFTTLAGTICARASRTTTTPLGERCGHVPPSAGARRPIPACPQGSPASTTCATATIRAPSRPGPHEECCASTPASTYPSSGT